MFRQSDKEESLRPNQPGVKRDEKYSMSSNILNVVFKIQLLAWQYSYSRLETAAARISVKRMFNSQPSSTVSELTKNT